MAPYACNPGIGDRQISQAHWPASLAKQVSFRFSETLPQRNKAASGRAGHLMPSPGTQAHTLAHTRAHTCIHHIHIPKTINLRMHGRDNSILAKEADQGARSLAVGGSISLSGIFPPGPQELPLRSGPTQHSTCISCEAAVIISYPELTKERAEPPAPESSSSFMPGGQGPRQCHPST